MSNGIILSKTNLSEEVLPLPENGTRFNISNDAHAFAGGAGFWIIVLIGLVLTENPFDIRYLMIFAIAALSTLAIELFISTYKPFLYLTDKDIFYAYGKNVDRFELNKITSLIITSYKIETRKTYQFYSGKWIFTAASDIENPDEFIRQILKKSDIQIDYKEKFMSMHHPIGEKLHFLFFLAFMGLLYAAFGLL